jgi:hypothetical protein
MARNRYQHSAPPAPSSPPLPRKPCCTHGGVGAEVGPEQRDVVKVHAAVWQRREIQRRVGLDQQQALPAARGNRFGWQRIGLTETGSAGNVSLGRFLSSAALRARHGESLARRSRAGRVELCPRNVADHAFRSAAAGINAFASAAEAQAE